jgi:hypothetical protein
MYFRSVDR